MPRPIGEPFSVPSYPDVLAQRYTDGVIKVGVRGTLNPQKSVRQRKDDASAEQAVTRKLNELEDKAGKVAASEAAASTSAEPATSLDAAERSSEDPLGMTDVLVCRPKRKRQEPTFLQPREALRDRATGSRHCKKPAEPEDDGQCCKKPACAALRAERDELRSQLAAEAAAHMQLREQLRELASESAEGSDAAALAGSASHRWCS